MVEVFIVCHCALGLYFDCCEHAWGILNGPVPFTSLCLCGIITIYCRRLCLWLAWPTDASLVIMFAGTLCVIWDKTKRTYRDICILIEWDVPSTFGVIWRSSLYVLYGLIRVFTLHRQQHSRQCGCCRIAAHTNNICGYIVVTPRHKQGYIHWCSVWHFQWRNSLRIYNLGYVEKRDSNYEYDHTLRTRNGWHNCWLAWLT